MSAPVRQPSAMTATEDQAPPDPVRLAQIAPRDVACAPPATSGTAELVIVTRNSRADLERSLGGILAAASAARAELLFVDRGSTDGTREYVASRCPGARAAWLESRDSIAEVLRTAVACARADVLVVMRPTLVPAASDAVARLVEHLQDHPYAAVAAPGIRGHDGELLESSRPKRADGDHAVEWAFDEVLAIRRADLEAVLDSWRRPRDPAIALHLFIALRRRGREIHHVRSIAMEDCDGGASQRLGRATRISAPISRLLARHPRYAWRLLGRRGTARLLYRAAARVLDIAIATTLLVGLAPMMIAIAIAVRLDSPGPALFRQRRLGRDAEPFDMYKFRTMRSDADHAPHARFVRRMISAQLASGDGHATQIFKVHPDPRVTRVGRFLRRASLDELPQLVNVLKGEMTLVGFRPPIPYEVSSYPGWYFRRFDGKPGLTGLWQVSGRNERSYEEMVRLDIEYANRRSWMLDLMVLARTVGAVVSGRGAY